MSDSAGRTTKQSSRSAHDGDALSRVEAEHGDPLAALDYVTVSIRNFHDAGSTTVVLGGLAILAALFDRLGRYEP